MSGAFKPYLGGTVSVGVRDSIVLSLVDNISPDAVQLLDVGCASGSLFRAPGGCRFSYVGVDISDVAIEEGRKLSPKAVFHTTPLESFHPKSTCDVIVLNEVLYFLTVDEAGVEIERYADYLDENGIIIISMKDDPKSRAIFSEARKKLQWVNGVLYQEKIVEAEFGIRKDRKRPAYLIGVFARSESIRSDLR